MLTSYLTKLRAGLDLTADEAAGAMTAIMSGAARADDIADYLVLLAEKGETAHEIAGSAIVMREQAHRIRPDVGRIVDVCGTGGDGSGTFNISTAVAFVVAGAGVPVAKHGNRAVSSRAGSADVLAALGVRVELSPEAVCREIEEIGIGFMFAPLFHPAMRHVAPIRAQLGRRTIFNLLGPLTNPASALHHIIGVYDRPHVHLIAEVAELMGYEHAIIVHGDGLDEFTTTGISHFADVRDDVVTEGILDATTFGIPRATKIDIAGGDAAVNADIIRAILTGEHGAPRDIVVWNAAAALIAADVAENWEAGIAAAEKSIDTRAAKKKLDAMIAFSNAAATSA